MKYIPQFDSSDCGAACLAMIADSYGSKFSLSQLRDLAGTDRHGTNLNGMIAACHALGFEADALKSPSKSLPAELPVPFIAHLDRSELGNHYIVVTSIKKNSLCVMDPDPNKGKKKLTKVEFEKNWSGYAIFLRPTPEFKVGSSTTGRISRFIPLFKPYLNLIINVVMASVLLTILGLIGAFYFSFLIDEVLPAKTESSLHVLSLGVLLLTLFQITLGSIRSHLLIHFSTKTSLTLNFSYLKHVFSLPLTFFENRKVGEILSRFTDGDKIRGILSNVALTMIMDVIMMMVVGVVLFIQNPMLFLIAVAVVPLTTAVYWSGTRFFRENYRTAMNQQADSQSFIVEALNGVSTIKGLNATSHIFHELEKRTIKVTKTGYEGSLVRNFQGILVGLLDGWAGNILFWVGSYFILKDHMTLGQLMAFNALKGYFLGPLGRLLALQTNIQEALVAADRLGEIMELPPEFDPEKSLLKPGNLQGEFQFRQVNFRYGTKRLVLEGLNFTIDPGTKVAFVGPSGCGKSTLIKLLMKFYDPEAGDILLDGKSLKDLDTPWLRSRIGYVPQEVFLFSGSIRENLSLHKPEATFDEIVEAATRAQAHDFITALPERYDTVLAERGASLSGGERQRLALARALLGRPEILIFDEATSALDVITEKAVHDTISDLAATGLTTILVAHRLATVAGCDRIFVMDKGRIIEQGSHQELVALGGAYTQLWEYQKL